jgi:hypothetical protein
MNPQEFCYWLQGFFELSKSTDLTLDVNQVQLIRNHLNMVFYHAIDPTYPAEQQEKLNEIHNTGKPRMLPPVPGVIVKC